MTMEVKQVKLIYFSPTGRLNMKSFRSGGFLEEYCSYAVSPRFGA